MANYKTFKKEKRIYFILAILVYFVPFIIVTACLFPIIRETGDGGVNLGMKIAVGFGIVIINAIPFIMGIFRSFFAHFPMVNILAFVFLCLGAFFTLDIFKACMEKLMWIELTAALGSIVSCVFWAKYRKYKHYQLSVAATVKSGAFNLKGGS